MDSEPTSFRYYVFQFAEKAVNFEFQGINLPKNRFWVRISKYFKSGFRISIIEILWKAIFRQNR